MVFLIIFGTRGVTMSVATGKFNCPGCDQTRTYVHNRVRRFFTLYFIPLIPLDVIGEYVECQHCTDTYNPSVLDFDPVKSERSMDGELRSRAATVAASGIAISTGLRIGPAACSSSVVARPSQNCETCAAVLNTVGVLRFPRSPRAPGEVGRPSAP